MVADCHAPAFPLFALLNSSPLAEAGGRGSGRLANAFRTSVLFLSLVVEEQNMNISEAEHLLEHGFGLREYGIASHGVNRVVHVARAYKRKEAVA